MRTTSRRILSLAILSSLMLASAPAWAGSETYTLTNASTAADKGWIGVENGNSKYTSNGYCFANTSASLTSPTFSTPITNIVFSGYRTASCTRKLTFKAGELPAEEWDTGTIVGTSLGDFKTNEYSAADGVLSFNIKHKSGSYNFYLKTVTIYWLDPPPSLGPIPNQTIGSANTIDNLPLYVTTSVSGETPSVSATTTSAIPAASYEAFEENGDWFFRFSPAVAGMTSGNIDFTVSATGIGGTTNLTFTVTVEEGVVKTPPAITLPIASTNAIALRDLIVPFTIHEADGDQVETNVVCIKEGVTGPYGHDGNGTFSYTPSLEDADLPQPITFGIAARDIEGAVTNYFNVTVTTGTPPVIGPIAPQTVTYDDMNEVTLALTPTEDDDITWTNVAVKAGTAEPVGEHTFSDLVFRFAPAADDIGQTFTFTASATDFDGTTNQDFNVTVGLAAPVLKHCPVEDWTTTSFTADIEAAVPGATSYRLRYIHTEANGTIVTGYVDNATFPCVVSGLDTTNYIYDVCAQRGAVTSTWSNAKSINLHNYIAPTYAIPMTGAARGAYHQDFNSLITSGNAYWYDARTIPGWYAASSSGSMSDERITASKGVSSETGILSCQVDADNIPNRALGLRAATQWDDFSFGAVFTNKCNYAVTNLTVTFTALQIRRYTTISKLHFSYARSNGFIELITSGLSWTDVEALRFTSPIQGSSAQLYPPATERLSASIPFEGANAIQPGEVIAMRWYLEAKNNYPTLGIDDLEVTWKCAYPQHTIISVR